MTVSDLIAKLSSYPADARVALLYPDKQWLLPIEITHRSADGSNREVDFIAITAPGASDEIEGLASGRPWLCASPHPPAAPMGPIKDALPAPRLTI
jgi:DNA-binding transcriptional LysR family regulator